MHSQGLAYETAGAGVPVVFLHGLTFNRRTWRPIIERLGGSVRSIAIDLPAHGESGGTPAPFDDVASQLHHLLEVLAVDEPIVVGHSMFGGLACLYAAAYPTRGIVVVDNGPDIRLFAQLAGQLEPDPSELQAWIDATLSKITVPVLGVFGRPLTAAESERFELLSDLELETWVGDGHFVHLVDPDRFAGRLHEFVEHCAAIG